LTTVVFVHGTGVRELSFEKSLDRVRSELAGRVGLKVVPCYWGGLGAELHQNGASIPRYDATRPAKPESAEEVEVALWGVLYDDPLYELRLLSLRQAEAAPFVPGRRSPTQELAELVEELEPQGELAEKLAQAGLAESFAASRAAVVASSAFADALAGAPAALAEYRTAIARAVLAEALARSLGDEPEVPRIGEPGERRIDAALRDEIVDLLIEDLGGKERALGWLKAKAGDLLAAAGTRLATGRRGSLTDGASPAVGDILRYQARGEKIRELIAKVCGEAEPPVVLLAHSLGGIACVDLLIGRSLGVELLVTAGSQAPFFFEIDALGSLAWGKALPEHFPRWLNLYDPRDFLSYVGGGVFPGRVKDVEVDNQQPFPASHSAYWENPHVWIEIGKELP
jgi:hypothetical protein